VKFDIVTFGGAVVDVFVDTDLPEKGSFMYYSVGSKISIKNIRFDTGGGGTNTAVAFSRLGFKTGCMTKVGDDNDGKTILGVLKKEKVKFLGKIEKNSVSGHSIVLDSKEHDRTILTYKGVNNNLRFEELHATKVKTKWLYLSSLRGESFKAQKKLSELLFNKGVKIAFNPSEYLIREENLTSLLEKCEILILNKEEAQLLLDKNKIRIYDVLLGLKSLGPKIVVVTDRDRPVMAYDGFRRYRLVPHKVKVVERTGAGDAFASGFVAGQMAGKSMEYSLKLGLKESESVIRYFGAKNKLLRMRLG
jgi:ribokinase